MPITINGSTGITFPDGTTQSDGLTVPVPVADGGTGATTAANARTNLGLVIGTDVLAPNGSGANLTSLNASNISSGTLAVANGGTGTSTPSLVGGTNITISGTWPNQTVTAAGGAPTTAQVLSATAGASAGEIGSYAWLGGWLSGTTANFGSTASGSTLRGAGIQQPYNAGSNWQTSISSSLIAAGDGANKSGTWRCMGFGYIGAAGCSSGGPVATLWLRIS